MNALVHPLPELTARNDSDNEEALPPEFIVSATHLFDLLLGEPHLFGEEERRLAEELGVDLDRPRGLLAITTVKGGEGMTPMEQALQACRRITSVREAAVVVRRPGGLPPHGVIVVDASWYGIWKAVLRVAQEASVEGDLLVASREPVVGPLRLRMSYDAALFDLRIGVALQRPSGILQSAELVVPRLLASLDEADRRDLIEPLQPLLGLAPSHRLMYLRTLAVLREGHSLVQSARLLHLHVNSVRRRIDRIEEITGLSLSNAKDLARLGLASLAYDLSVELPGPAEDM